MGLGRRKTRALEGEEPLEAIDRRRPDEDERRLEEIDEALHPKETA